jgi:hypothetical protein
LDAGLLELPLKRFTVIEAGHITLSSGVLGHPMASATVGKWLLRIFQREDEIRASEWRDFLFVIGGKDFD